MVLIKRPIYGCTLNGLECVHDENNNVAVFRDIEDAKAFLFAHGYTDKQIEDEGIIFDASGMFSDEEMDALLEGGRGEKQM